MKLIYVSSLLSFLINLIKQLTGSEILFSVSCLALNSIFPLVCDPL